MASRVSSACHVCHSSPPVLEVAEHASGHRGQIRIVIVGPPKQTRSRVKIRGLRWRRIFMFAGGGAAALAGWVLTGVWWLGLGAGVLGFVGIRRLIGKG